MEQESDGSRRDSKDLLEETLTQEALADAGRPVGPPGFARAEQVHGRLR